MGLSLEVLQKAQDILSKRPQPEGVGIAVSDKDYDMCMNLFYMSAVQHAQKLMNNYGTN